MQQRKSHPRLVAELEPTFSPEEDTADFPLIVPQRETPDEDEELSSFEALIQTVLNRNVGALNAAKPLDYVLCGPIRTQFIYCQEGKYK